MNTRLLYSLLFCLCTTFSFGQSKSGVEYKTRVLSAGAELGIYLKTPAIETNGGFRLGGFGEFPVGDNLYFVIGLGYADFGAQETYLDITANGTIDVMGADLHVYRKGTYDYKYFSIPLLIRLRKGNFFASTGFMPHVYFRHLVQYSDDYVLLQPDLVGGTFNVKEIRQFNTTFNLGIGYELKLGNDFGVFVEPQINYFLGHIFNSNNDFINDQINRLNLMVNIGIRKSMEVQKRVSIKEDIED